MPADSSPDRKANAKARILDRTALVKADLGESEHWMHLVSFSGRETVLSHDW